MPARPTRPRQPPNPPASTPARDAEAPRVSGTPQRRRAVRAADQGPPRPAAGRARPAAGARPVPRTSAPSVGPQRSRVADLAGARRARRWRPARRTIGVLVAVLAVVVVGCWVLFGSPWLRVDQIRITGTERTDLSAVEAIVDGQQGNALARVNTRSLSSDVSDLPLVESVEVTRSWPSTLVVAVHERQAVAAVPSTGGGVDLVDGEGTVLVHTDSAPTGVPTVDVDVATDGEAALQAAIAVNASLSTDVRSEVASISATSQDAVTLQLSSGPKVVWGDAGRPERKAEVLLRLLQDPTVASSAVIDVSAPDAPAVTR